METTNNQLVTTDNGLNAATQLVIKSHHTGIGQGDPEAATCTPTIPGNNPSEVVPEPTPSPVTPTYTDETGFGPRYEHPFWALLYEAGYRQW